MPIQRRASGRQNKFEHLFTDFTLLSHQGGRVWFLPILDHRTRMVLAFGVSPSPTAEAALEVWERAKAFIQERTGRKPKALVHHDQGGAFLSHEWVGRLLLEDGQRVSYSLMGPRGNPVMESFFARFKGRTGTLSLRAFLLGKHLAERLHSGLVCKKPMEAWPQALETASGEEARGVPD